MRHRKRTTTAMTMTTTQELACPQCKKKVLWNEDFPHRPFCSQRCQLIDLGDWAEEKFKIPVSGNNESDGEEWE